MPDHDQAYETQFNNYLRALGVLCGEYILKQPQSTENTESMRFYFAKPFIV